MNIGSIIPASISQSDPLKQAIDVQLMRKSKEMSQQQEQIILDALPKSPQQSQAATHPYLGQRIDIRF